MTRFERALCVVAIVVGVGTLLAALFPKEPRLAHMKVEGGTIYRLEGGSSLVFVPDPVSPPRKP